MPYQSALFRMVPTASQRTGRRSSTPPLLAKEADSASRFAVVSLLDCPDMRPPVRILCPASDRQWIDSDLIWVPSREMLAALPLAEC